MNPIFLLFTCDAWKSHASMRLLMATTIPETMNGLICDKLLCGDMQFRGFTGADAVNLYTTDPNSSDLEFGYLEKVGDGEIL